MKRSKYSICNIILPLFSTLLLLSCTLVDNDLRDLPDIPGFKDIVYDEDENIKVEYQFNEDVHYLNNDFQNYIASIDYANGKLYLYGFIPKDELLEKGELIFAQGSDKLEYGLGERVTDIRRVGDYYEVSIERAPLKDIYKHLVIDGEFDSSGDIQEDTIWTDESGNITRADGINHRKRYDDAGEWKYLNLSQLIAGNYMDYAKVPSTVFAAEANVAFDALTSNSTTITLRKLGSLKGKKEAIEGTINLNGGFYIRWRPISKTYININTEQDIADIKTSLGIEVEKAISLKGYGEITIHLKRLLPETLSDKLKIKLPLYKPINLYLIIDPDIDFSFGIEGEICKIMKKSFWIEAGSSKGVKGKKEEGYVEKKQSEFEQIDLFDEDKEAYKSNTQGKLSGYVSLYGVLIVQVCIGDPDRPPVVGIELKGKIGPKLTYTRLSSDPYNDGIDLGIHSEITGKFFLNLTKYLTWDWNFVQTLKEKFKGTEKKFDGEEKSDETVVEKDWPLGKIRAYPSLDNVGVECLNPNIANTDPKFVLSYDVLEFGSSGNGREITYPTFRLFNADDPKDALWDTEDNMFPGGSYVIIDRKKVRDEDGMHFTINLDKIAEEKKFKFQRDKFYELEIEMKRQLEYPIWGGGPEPPYTLYKKRYKFSSTSPTAVIDDYEITYMCAWGKLLKSDYFTNTVNVSPPYLFDWTFRTAVSLNGFKDIRIWGFYVNNKKYDVNTPPASNTATAIWHIKNIKQSDATLKIRPYAISKDNIIGYGPEYVVKLNYESYRNKIDDKWGINTDGKPTGDRYRKEKIQGSKDDWLYGIGFDQESTLSKSGIVSFDINK